jgi:hypothetical protein
MNTQDAELPSPGIKTAQEVCVITNSSHLAWIDDE